MDCPYCKELMKLGTIDVNDTLSWSPIGEKRIGSTKYALARNGIVLAKFPFFFAASKEAYFCPSYKKIIINID